MADLLLLPYPSLSPSPEDYFTLMPSTPNPHEYDFTFTSLLPPPAFSSSEVHVQPAELSSDLTTKASFSSLRSAEETGQGKNIWLPYSEYNIKQEERGRGSPPSPSTIESTTSSHGAPSHPPSSISSLSSHPPPPSSASATAQAAYRARSVSQPSSFSGRRGNLSLTIPQHFPIQQLTHEAGTGGWGSPGESPAMGGGGQGEYYWTEVMEDAGAGGPMDMSGGGEGGGTMMLGGGGGRGEALPLQQMQMEAYLPDGTIAGPNVRYGYRMPASQPSSPVRSGFPPGMAPYNTNPSNGNGNTAEGQQMGYSRPRGATVSGMGYHPGPQYGDMRMSFQGVTGQGVAPLMSSPGLVDHSGGLAYPFTPLDSPGIRADMAGLSTTQTSSGAGSVHVGPFIQQGMHMTGMAASPTQIQPRQGGGGAGGGMDDMTIGRGAGLVMQYQMAEPSQQVSQLESQVPQYGLGVGDISMEQSQSMQGFPPQQQQAGSVAGSIHEEMFEEAARQSQSGSRRSSTSVQAFHAGGGFAAPMTPMTGAGAGMMTMPDLSSQIHDKLSLIESIVNDANAARAELLRGQGGAADDRLSDIGNRLMGNSYGSSGSGSITPGGMGSLTMPPIAESSSLPGSVPPSPVALGPRDGVTPVGLAPAFELMRSNSSHASKRAAPESPPMAAMAAPLPPHKHIKLADHPEGEEMEMGVRPESTPVLSSPVPPAMVHSHSYPNGHQLPSQTTTMQTNMAPTSPITPAMASSAFTSSLNLPAHAPHVPSPLSNLHMSSHPPSPVMFYQTPMTMPDGSAMLDWDPSQQTYQQQDGMYYPDTFSQSEGDSVFVPVHQPTTLHRRGSIVDGRLIAGRPTLTHRQSGDMKAASSSAVPTMSAFKPEYSGNAAAGPSGDGGGDDDGDSDSGGEDGSPRPNGRRRRSSEGGGGGGAAAAKAAKGKLVQPASLVSKEIKEQLDRIMFEFLNRVCSNLEITDSKGELLHQVLMAKKMARLDESTDFRPFKFRIQAFTNAFHEELLSRGVMDETLSGKKVKSYLWTHNLISRFNDDGKKSKSKGNHIWNVEAKKLPDGSWVFREFRRKIGGALPEKAVIGQHWSWQPRVWDPQASTNGLVVDFYSPENGLPRWLRWSGSSLSGTPGEGDTGGEVMAIAAFMDSDNTRHVLSTSFQIVVESGNGSAQGSASSSRAAQDDSSMNTQESFGEGYTTGLSVMSPSPMRDMGMHKPFNAFSNTMPGDQDMDGSHAMHTAYTYPSLPLASSSMPVLQHSAYDAAAGTMGEGFYGNGQ